MTPRRIGLIGGGAIATDVAAGLLARSHVVVQYARTAGSSLAGTEAVESLQALIAGATELVIEAASQTAVRDLAPPCLAAGRSVVISSVGALADEALFDHLRREAETGGGQLILPSGAIGALDYLRAARLEGDTEVIYESRKPIAAWAAELRELGIDPETLKTTHVLFEGEARTAALKYPANLNVAATLALAGQGFERTRVRVVVDPSAAGNTHAVSVNGPLGTMQICIANKAAKTNPKSSMIVSRSILSAVDHFYSTVKML